MREASGQFICSSGGRAGNLRCFSDNEVAEQLLDYVIELSTRPPPTRDMQCIKIHDGTLTPDVLIQKIHVILGVSFGIFCITVIPLIQGSWRVPSVSQSWPPHDISGCVRNKFSLVTFNFYLLLVFHLSYIFLY